MYKNIVKTARCGVAVIIVILIMFSGCGNKNVDESAPSGGNSNTVDETKIDDGAKPNNGDLVQSLRAKYADETSSAYDYADPMYDLEQNHEFVFADLSSCYGNDAPEGGYERRLEAVKFYIDPEFKYPLQVDIADYNFDLENNTLTIAPGKYGGGALSFLENEERGWGNAAKYWMVQYEDLSTGEALAKPLVTVFTIARTVGTPTLEFGVTTDGYASFSWNAVEGADSYKIYSGSISPDYGMAFSTLTLVGETKETSYTDFPEKAFSMEDMGVLRQNGFFNVAIDENNMYEYQSFYCVAAVSGDRCSNISNAVYMEDIAPRLPREIAYEYTIYGSETSSQSELMSQFPSQFPVRKVDGTVSPYVIDYKNANMQVDSSGYVILTAKLIGTDISNTLYANNVDEGSTAEDILAELRQRQSEMESKSSGTAPKDEIDYVPQTEPPTQPDVSSPDPQQSAESSSEASEATQEADSSASAESATVQENNLIADSDISISATSAMSEYLAMNMLSHVEVIDMSLFNEAGDSDYLRDALLEAYYQNPLIGSIYSYGYDYSSRQVFIDYSYSAQEQRNIQEQVWNEVKSVTAQIITDGMSDLDKEIAINQYLCDTAEYDYSALENAEENNYEYTDPEYADSFTPAGVLLNKTGVCASYAGAFKLLADAAGVNCVVVSGNLNGNLPHAWDRVQINGEWLTIDPTNNDTELYPNALLNLSDSAAAGLLVEDSEYLMDDLLAQMTSNSDEQEFYRVEGKYYAEDDLPQALNTLLTSSEGFHIRTDYDISEDRVIELLKQSVRDTGVSIDGAGLFLGVITVKTAQ